MTSGHGMLPPDPLVSFKDTMGHVHCLNFPKRNPDYSDVLLAGTEKGEVFFWDLECNRLQFKQKMGQSIQAIHSIEYHIITQEKSGLIKLWSIENNTGYKPQRSIQSYGGFCKSILVNNQLVLSQEAGRLDTIDLETFKTVRQFVPDRTDKVGNPMCLEFFEIRGTLYLFAGYECGLLIVFDYVTAKKCCQLKFKEFITSITFDPGTLRGVVANSSDTLQIFRFELDTLKFVIQAELAMSNSGCQVVKFRPDHKLLLAGGWDGRLRVYSWRTLRTLVILREHKKQVSDIQFSPSVVRYWDSKIFASGSADGIVSLWNVYHSYTY
ncbi:guanine nucleotide-binding protein subunit beta-like protein 1 [Euwallacea fornicatus]|uniref:guanine nucleotide-binding protein subunit beta-like protein 1 n=1 Tax=Euwallacea fornicatus TaxID=995702 RepID=UPI0033903E97